MKKALPEVFRVKRLRSIDALRGAAALFVVLYHIVGAKPQVEAGGLRGWLLWPVLQGFSFGYTGVFLFFVISGFCIHLQWARRSALDQKSEINFLSFWKRRIRRLYPPYLIALALYLGLTALTVNVQVTPFYLWDVGLHLAMLHNLDPRTSYSINGVFWTLAIEEQLYMAYFLLLFLRRQWGWKVALFCCALARIGWLVLAQVLKSNFEWNLPVTEAAATHWFTWALGALSVEAAFGLTVLPGWCRKSWCGVLALAYAVGLTMILPRYDDVLLAHDALWLTLHPAWGLGFFILLNRAVQAEDGWLRRLHTPRLAAGLAAIGVFSYSLYLIHELVLMEAWRVNALPLLNRLPLSPLSFTLLFMTPLTIACAWVFFRLCERPYMSRPAAVQTPTGGQAAGEVVSALSIEPVP